ncbi:hypothetical protein QT969_09955 [Rhodococcus sp. CSLK01-03]|uniref:Uncharacterized protein n=1 Tax=Rhodococcus indonesiensis TaxID=3055869 RepID=A0ABT7RLV5_9NOCA|nr:hypothetical protein [Rhodococcus indonesiensis]MDM7488613.1 hypothetical protein [Rhodococcus indonesiensis]
MTATADLETPPQTRSLDPAIAARVQALVAAAPPLSPQRRARIATLLGAR